VKHPLSLQQLASFLNLNRIIISTEQYDQFQTYKSLILSWSSRQNLLSKNDLVHIVERHFLASLLFFDLIDFSWKDKIIDIGSGAGFPGIVLKIIKPELTLTLIDSSKKKYLFLQEVNESLSLNCEIIYGRIENYNFKKEKKYNVAVSRGVTDLIRLWSWVRNILSADGKLYCLKGGNINSEISEFSDEDDNIKINCHFPKDNWKNYSNYIGEKFIVKIEKLYG
jgi:16S rRNA (guanine527-N7)-methyltransferase